MKVFVYLSLYTLLMNSAFAAGKKKIEFREYLIDHYATFFHSKFKSTIDTWNSNHKSPKKLLSLVPNQKDKDYLEKGLVESGIKKFPKLERTEKGYFYKTKDVTLSFKIEDAFDGHVWVNGKKFKLVTEESAEDRAQRLATIQKKFY